MIHSNYKTPLFLGLISTLILPFLTFVFISLFLIRLEINLDIFSPFYTIIDLLYAFFFLVVYVGNLFLLKTLFWKIPFAYQLLKTFRFLLKSNFVLFFFLTIATILFTIEPKWEWTNSFWLICFSIGLILNICIGIFLIIYAKSKRKMLFLWIGLAFIFAQIFDYSGFRILLVYVENLTPDLIWNYLGFSVFDYENLQSEMKNMFDEITLSSLFFTLSLGACFVLVRTVALAIFYVLVSELLFFRRNPKRKYFKKSSQN